MVKSTCPGVDDVYAMRFILLSHTDQNAVVAAVMHYATFLLTAPSVMVAAPS
jgi:hypothetical protein